MEAAAKITPIVTLTMEIRRKDGTHETVTVPATIAGVDELEKLLEAQGQKIEHVDALRELVSQQEPDANG